MTKLSIEIEDISDKRGCRLALQKLFRALREHHGKKEAENIMHFGWQDRAEIMAWKRFSDACSPFEPGELRLVLEYYAMVKPSKLGLAKELARRNETLPPAERYGPNGSTDEETMHQQIKRAFRWDKEACRIIGEAAPELREEALQWATQYCRMRIEARERGRPKPSFKRARTWV